jgi:hypothetical protein
LALALRLIQKDTLEIVSSMTLLYWIQKQHNQTNIHQKCQRVELFWAIRQYLDRVSSPPSYCGIVMPFSITSSPSIDEAKGGKFKLERHIEPQQIWLLRNLVPTSRPLISTPSTTVAARTRKTQSSDAHVMHYSRWHTAAELPECKEDVHALILLWLEHDSHETFALGATLEIQCQFRGYGINRWGLICQVPCLCNLWMKRKRPNSRVAMAKSEQASNVQTNCKLTVTISGLCG